MQTIPESELNFEFTRSSGPGGQNVNKTSTKAQLRWHVLSSSVFSNNEKLLILEKLANRLTQNGFIAIDISEERSQAQNKERAIELLHELIAEALKPAVPRLPTRPTLASKVDRLNTKRKRGNIKKLRKSVAED